MYAVVLTFDRYKAFSQHMIICYQELWPDNPFIFRIPYQSVDVKEEYKRMFGEKVELIKSPSGIVDTVFSLVEDLDDKSMVFWCMDDRYPISINIETVNKLHKMVMDSVIDNLSSLLFVSTCSSWTSNNVWWMKFKENNKCLPILHRRKWYRNIWFHQYLRVDFIKEMFSHFPKAMKQAKEMDYILHTMILPEKFHLYMTQHNYGVYGESTSRGKILINTVESFQKHGLCIPEGFEISNKSTIVGTSTFVDKLFFEFKYEIKRLLGI